MKKRICSIWMLAALLLALAACTALENTEETAGTAAAQPGTTYTGTVSAISTQSLTVTTDEGTYTFALTDSTSYIREFTMAGLMGGNMAELPADMGQLPGSMSDAIDTFPAEGTQDVTAPADTDSTVPPERPEGEAAGDQSVTPPELPQDDPNATAPELPQDDPNAAAPELPQDAGDQSGLASMDPTATQTMEATIAELFIGASVTVVTDENGAAATVTVSGDQAFSMLQPGSIDPFTGEDTTEATAE